MQLSSQVISHAGLHQCNSVNRLFDIVRHSGGHLTASVYKSGDRALIFSVFTAQQTSHYANGIAPITARTPACTPILNLPVELFERVAELADPVDLLSLKLVSKEVARYTRRTYVSLSKMIYSQDITYSYPQITTYFEHRGILVGDDKEVETAIEVAKHPELGSAAKTLSLCMGCPGMAMFLDVLKLRELFFHLERGGCNMEILITNTNCDSPRRRSSATAYRKCKIQSRDTFISHFRELTCIQEELHSAGLRVNSFNLLGELRCRDGFTRYLGVPDVELWKPKSFKMEHLSLHVSHIWGKVAMLTELPYLRSLHIAGGSFKDLTQNVEDSPEMFRFPQLERLRLDCWSTDIESLLTFIRGQPKLEKVDLGDVSWALGTGNSLAEIAQNGESLQELLYRLTGVQKVTADIKAEKWIAGLIKARLG